jgi:hypothetical protein
MTKTKRDHSIAIVKAALNSVPIPGLGGIASLIDDYVPTSREKAINMAVMALQDSLQRLQSRIDEDLVKTEEFAELFNKFAALAEVTNRPEKLNAAANLLANSLLKTSDKAKSAFDELDHLMTCLDKLSIGAITLLGAAIAVRPPRHASGGDVTVRPRELAQALHTSNLDLIMGLASELRAMHLIQLREGSVGPPDETALIRVTPMGARFAERFIEGHQ